LTGGKGAEVVFDAVGGPTFEKLAEATAIGGLLIAYGRFSPDVTPLPLAKVLWKDLTIRGLFSRPALRSTISLRRSSSSSAKDSRPVRYGRSLQNLPFDEIVAAHRYLETGAQFGKVVVTV